ncbi:MAG: rhodanese-like domain-containing protein [Acidobacteriota bacterium]
MDTPKSDRRMLGILKLVLIDIGIILAAAWIGVSLNRSFIAGPQAAYFEYDPTAQGTRFKPISAAQAATAGPLEGIELSELQSLKQVGRCVLLDGRTAKEYQEGRIPGALHLAALQFDKAFPLFSKRFPKDTEIVVYCSGTDCSLSRTLAESLKRNGYEKVRVFWGGYSSWTLGGNPIEKGPGISFSEPGNS